MNVRWMTGLLPGLALLLASAPSQPRSCSSTIPPPHSRPEQVARGQAAYGRVCVSCHGAALEGGQFGPTLKGDTFADHWRSRTRAAFSEQVRSTMPPRGLGMLSGQAYSDIESYILQANGLAPAGGHGRCDAAASAAAPVAAPVGQSMEGGRPRSVALRNLDDPLYKAAEAARAAKLDALSPVSDAMLRNPPESDWLIWRRRYDASGFSPLKQIDRRNVGQLRMAWSWSLPDSMNEITPLVHDGVMFIYSGPVVQALDATTGALLWQYLRVLPDEYDNGRASRVKTLALYGHTLIAPFVDGHVVALDVRTGQGGLGPGGAHVDSSAIHAARPRAWRCT